MNNCQDMDAHVNLRGLFNAKAIPVGQVSEEIRRFNIFPKGIWLKVKVQAWLEFELAYYDVAVNYVSHYAMGTISALFSILLW